MEDFWNKNLCGKHFITAKYPSEDFFKQYCDFRYSKEHHLNYLIDWHLAKDKDVLEIGLGVGADGTRWATYANSYTGVDLTTEAIVATKLHLKLYGKDITLTTIQGDHSSSRRFDNNTLALIKTMVFPRLLEPISKYAFQWNIIITEGSEVTHLKNSFPRCY